jgi:transposase-like protein
MKKGVMEMKKSYDIAYKVQVCKRVIEGGELVPTVATELDINENTLYTWVSKNEAGESITQESISKQLNHPAKNSLVGMLKNNYKYSAPESKDLKGILEKLIEKKCVKFNNSYLLEDNFAFFCKWSFIARYNNYA